MTTQELETNRIVAQVKNGLLSHRDATTLLEATYGFVNRGTERRLLTAEATAILNFDSRISALQTH
jgi:hypothetical protein